MELTSLQSEKQHELDEKTERWLYLNDLADRIAKETGVN